MLAQAQLTWDEELMAEPEMMDISMSSGVDNTLDVTAPMDAVRRAELEASFKGDIVKVGGSVALVIKT